VQRIGIGKILVLGVCVIAANGCGDGLCENTEVARYSAPNGQRDLIVFERSCGATTGFSTQATLVQSGREIPSGAGNVFIADTDHGAAPAAPHGGPQLNVAWETDAELRLSHHPNARVFLAVEQLEEVTFIYDESPPDR
jgi:hypothetical protein